MQTTHCPITIQTVQNGQAPALLLEDLQTIDYQTLDRWIATTSTKLLAKGIQKHQRIALISPNNPELLVLFFALLRIGAIPLPVPTRFPLSQIEKTLIPLQCTTWLIAQRYWQQYNTPLVKRYSLEGIVGSVHSQGSQKRRDRHEHQEKGRLPHILPLDQDATILLTSGSSGTPKAVLHTYRNHLRSAQGSNQNIKLQPNDRWLMSLPLYHVAGIAIAFRCFIAGACIAYPTASESLRQAIQKRSVSHVSMVATQLHRFLEQKPKHVTTKLKAVLLGGSAISASLLSEAKQHDLPIFTSYGSTEMSSQITCTQAKKSSQPLDNSGKLLPYRRMKIATDGEIWVSGETRFKGYVEPNGIIQPFDGDGWFATGDLGEIDTEGQLQIIGRKDNMFISGGENIQPEEIEKALCLLPAIQKAIVVPIQDPEYGQKAIAFIDYNEGPLPIDIIKQHLYRHIARFKVPKDFLLWPTQECTMGIKVDRKQLGMYAQKKLIFSCGQATNRW